uniref:ATP-dependent DNA helicase n=1 Tax=Salix viminalis TaxID=40686 RepID=A0A6N2KZF5_SALVM
MGAKLDLSINEGNGPYVNKINGHCHHLIGSFLPTESDAPKFAQLYVYETLDEIKSRMSVFITESGSSSLDAIISNYKLQLIGKRDNDLRQYDDPSLNDIDEEDRIDYIRAHQSDLRSENYKGIHEAILRGDVEGNIVGLLEEIRNKLLREELNYDIVDLISQHSITFPVLNEYLRIVYEYVITIVMKKTSFNICPWIWRDRKNFFMAYNNKQDSIHGLIILAVAPSGIASLLLSGGRTMHLRFTIPLMVSETSSCEINKEHKPFTSIEITSLIIWDEAPMNNRCCFEALDRSLQNVLACNGQHTHNQPFGGMLVLLGGDFRQILSMVAGGTR